MPWSESRVWESWLPRSVTPDAELRVNSDLTGNALPLLLALRARPAFDFVCLKSQSGSPHLRSRMRNGFPRHSAACLHQDNMYVSSTRA